MAESGVKSPNIPSAPIVEDFLGNRNGSTVRIPTDAAALQLLATAPFQMLTNAGKLFETYAELAVAPESDITPWVFADPDPKKNGIYRRIGAAWVWAMPLPYSFIKATNAGAGTPSAIQADTGIPVSEVAMVILPIAETNDTSPVTVSFNGEAALTLKTNSGNDIEQGGLVEGMLVVGVQDGEDFRLITDQVSSAIIAQAEALVADALASAMNAAGSEARANKFANYPEDQEVIPGSGLFSTNHFLAKVQALWQQVVNGVAGAIAGSPAKAAPVLADKVTILDSQNGDALATTTIQKLLALGNSVPVGTIISVYGNGTTTPVGYLKVVPGLEVTNAYPQLRAFGLSDGWAVNGGGNPVMPTVDASFLRGWRSGQGGNDAGRVFGSVQQDAIQNITGELSYLSANAKALSNPAVAPTGAFKSGNVQSGSLVQPGSGSSVTGTSSLMFDASGSVRTAAETRSVNITVTYFIKAYDGVTDPATLSSALVVSDLADSRARVAALEAKGTFMSAPVIMNAAGSQTLNGIPPAAKRVRLKLVNVTKSTTGNLNLVLGTAAGLVTAGYRGSTSQAYNSAAGALASTVAFPITINLTSAHDGWIELSRQGPGLHNWTIGGNLAHPSPVANSMPGGSCDLGAELTQLALVPASGTISGAVSMEYQL